MKTDHVPAIDEPLAPGRGAAGETLPATLSDQELAGRLGLGLTQFYKRKAIGHFTFLELVPQLPNSNTRYSGVLVGRWLRGEDPRPATARSFFNGARDSRRPTIAEVRKKSRRTGRPRTIQQGSSEHAETIRQGSDERPSNLVGGAR